MSWKASCLFLLALVGATRPLPAQQTGEWNTPRVLELIERARARRAAPRADSGLYNYQARANGYVYFFLDHRDSEERTLVKVDQLALEVYWQAPNHTKQRIVGLRDVSRLPNRMYYHLDHLTVVQDGFGDVIRLGDGDEVRDVPHPVAPGADSIYDYRLADSLTLSLPGSPRPVRVYEVEVRPIRPDRPAFVGSLFLDQATAHIVRMTFTFTPAAYVDRRLDYIQISLDNALWEGRYWLPHEQRLEIRRQLPELDFPIGSVIRGVLRISDYRFNQTFPVSLFSGPPVEAAPRIEREAYPFEQGLFDGLNEEGLAPPPQLSELRKMAVELIGRRRLSALPRLRFHLPNASSALRYNRAEGLFLGGGAAYTLGGLGQVEARLGYATGPGQLSAGSLIRLNEILGLDFRLEAHRNALRDLGIRPGIPGALNTILAATSGVDYLDPYFASGGSIAAERRLSDRWRLTLGLALEEHRSARLDQHAAPFDDSALFRTVRPIDEGTFLGGRLLLRRTPSETSGLHWSGELALDAGTLEGEAFGRPTATLTAAYRSPDRKSALEVRGAAGLGFGRLPAQHLFLLGGRATLPGYAYRGFGGDRFALGELEFSHEVVGPWVRLRALGAIGWTDFARSAPPPGWDVAPTGTARASLGAGVGLIYDILRIDLVRGLNGGQWQAVLSVHPGLRDIL